MARSLRILVRAAAGPRIGFGHLIRARSLARALDGLVTVSVRGTLTARDLARRLGLNVVDGPIDRAIAAAAPDVIVIDDPSRSQGRAALAAARRARRPAASLHDRGLALISADVIVDGSISPPMAVRDRTVCCGPRYAVLDPAYGRSGRRALRDGALPAPRVLVALGGGPRAAVAAEMARAVVRRYPRARVRVAAGLLPGRAAAAPRVEWLGPCESLLYELTRCDVAILAGGMTLYEAAALGTPVVAVAIVTAQIGTVRAFARAGAALDGGAAIACTAEDLACVSGWTATCVARLATSGARRAAMSRRGRRLVDGRGAWRVAAALGRLARAHQPTRRDTAGAPGRGSVTSAVTQPTERAA